MVGQRFISLLAEHPWFEVVTVAASPRSAGKSYKAAVAGRWSMNKPVPKKLENLVVRAVEADFDQIAKEVDVIFCALDMDKEAIKKIEIAYAGAGIAVISNNSAHRWTPDVPMLMPEVNPSHIKLIDMQRKSRNWTTGLIAVKPNCSIQSYVSILTALKEFSPTRVAATSLQAISGAGKNFKTWPEMIDNVIPFIGGEEDKSEKEPMKIWGKLSGGTIKLANIPSISAVCVRIPVTDGHLASVAVKFKKNPTKQQILGRLKNFKNPLAPLKLPSAPQQLIHYLPDEDRPQTALDRDLENGMAITMGRLREDKYFDWQFVTLSHNTIRGAAGGAILMAELLVAKDYIQR
ncbi:aspartate-semialdehyde dehydrogenase [Candidatus Saccharibacteria bacterium]|nr:aspartate-semialdehyde dehydrogenase [Candidatus Saccharibacteria bacterium]